MNKLYATLLTVGLSIPVFAVQQVPLNTQGNSLEPRYSGVKTCVLNTSTGTNAVLCATGQGIVLDVIAGSITTNAIVFRDSATANLTSSTLTVVAQAQVTPNHIYPRFNNGLSANLFASAAAGAETWTVVYTQDIK